MHDSWLWLELSIAHGMAHFSPSAPSGVLSESSFANQVAWISGVGSAKHGFLFGVAAEAISHQKLGGGRSHVEGQSSRVEVGRPAKTVVVRLVWQPKGLSCHGSGRVLLLDFVDDPLQGVDEAFLVLVAIEDVKAAEDVFVFFLNQVVEDLLVLFVPEEQASKVLQVSHQLRLLVL